jgi:hypothetical protein
MVAMVSALAASVRTASVDLPPTIGQVFFSLQYTAILVNCSCLQPIEKNAREVAESMPRLVTAIKRVHQNPNSDKAQVTLFLFVIITRIHTHARRWSCLRSHNVLPSHQ